MRRFGCNAAAAAAFGGLALLPLALLPLPSLGLRLAALGDFGAHNGNAKKVGRMIEAWGVDDVLALGDCNYPYGSGSTIDSHVGRYYAQFISPYKGGFGSGSPNGNHFWPVPGNHDYGQTCGDFKDGCSTSSCGYDSLGGYRWFMPVERTYYSHTLGDGLVEIFAVDSNCNQPDGTDQHSNQAHWLRQRLASSTATWKLVIMHHSPYSSGRMHGSLRRLQWPFRAWGADVVLSAHDHLYERIHHSDDEGGDMTYFVNGVGGNGLYGWGRKVSGSASRFSSDYGAMLIELQPDAATFKFFAACSWDDPYACEVDSWRLTKA